MPDLSNTIRWVEYPPDLLGNLEDERPFYFLLHGSLSKAQMRSLREALSRKVGPEMPADLPEKATEEQKTAHAAELEAHAEAVTKAIVERDAEAMADYVQLGAEPLNVDGKQIKTLRDYLEFVMPPRLLGLGAYMEVQRALTAANTMEPRVSFSSGRHSGGSTSTGQKRPAGRMPAR